MYQTLAGIYIRVSTQEQAENGYSVDEQTDRLKKYVEAMNWTLYKAYTDAGFSGSNTNRPALQRMIKDVKLGKLNKIIVYKLDRLSRSQKDTLMLIEDVFLANGCDFVSMSENFDTATPFGRAMIGILAVFAQLEREQITERMMMGKDARAKLGKFHGSNHVPIGYDYIGGELVTNEFEKTQVIKAYELFNSGKSVKGIATYLNSHGYQHKFGKWNDVSVKRILGNKTYLGYTKHKGNWYKGTHESFIDENTYEESLRILAHRSQLHENNLRLGKARSYFGGFIFCAHCGAKYIKTTTYGYLKDGTRKDYYTYECASRLKKSPKLIKDPNCKNKIYRMADFDEIIFSELRKLALDPDGLKEVKKESPDTKSIQDGITRIDEKIDRLLDLYELGNMPITTLQERIKTLYEQKESLENELIETQDIIPAVDIKDYIETVEDVLNAGSFDDIRTIISDLIDKIEVDGEDITIYWKFN